MIVTSFVNKGKYTGTMRRLGKTVFDVRTVITCLQISELGRSQHELDTPNVHEALTVRNAEGRCCSAQKRSGVSRVTEYGIEGDHV